MKDIYAFKYESELSSNIDNDLEYITIRGVVDDNPKHSLTQLSVSHFVPRFVHAQVTCMNYNIIYIFRISYGIQ